MLLYTRCFLHLYIQERFAAHNIRGEGLGQCLVIYRHRHAETAAGFRAHSLQRLEKDLPGMFDMMEQTLGQIEVSLARCLLSRSDVRQMLLRQPEQSAQWVQHRR